MAMRTVMLRSGLVFIALCAISLLTVGCGNRPGHAVHPVEVGESGDGNEIELLEGQILEVTLPENRSTGYRWMVETHDENVLEQLGSGSYAPDEGASGLVGSGGEVRFRFKGVRPGETDLELGNLPPGEDEAEETFGLSVRVMESHDTDEHESSSHSEQTEE